MDHIDSKSMQPSETLGLLANFKKIPEYCRYLKGIIMDKDQIIKILNSDDPKGTVGSFFPRPGSKKNHNRGPGLFVWFCIFHNLVQKQLRLLLLQGRNPIDRYRKTFEETKTLSMELAKSGVHLIDLTMGEDPEFHKEGFQSVMELTKTIKAETGLPVMISPGYIPDQWIDGFAEAGADWYALYQETHNRELFSRLRLESKL